MNIPILLYHSVSDEATRQYQPWAISPSNFEQHMAYLAAHGYQPMTVGNIANAIKSGGCDLPTRPVGITFDDGLADFLYGAVPILKKYNFSSTLFVATSYIGETSRWLEDLGEQNRPMLTWEQITALENVDIGSHGHTHLQMDTISLSQSQDEIVQSKKLLEENLNCPVETFAFPHGYHTKELLDIVAQSGYTSSCIVGHAMTTNASNVFALPRIIITSDVSTTTLEHYLQGVGLRNHNAWREVLKVTWRMVRQMKALLR